MWGVVYVVRSSQIYGPFFLRESSRSHLWLAALCRFSFFLRSNVKRFYLPDSQGAWHPRERYQAVRLLLSTERCVRRWGSGEWPTEPVTLS